MRSWVATGNNLLNAHDIKEGMEHAGGIKNVKVAVAEIIPDAGMRLVNTKQFSLLLSLYFKTIWTKLIFQISRRYVQSNTKEEP